MESIYQPARECESLQAGADLTRDKQTADIKKAPVLPPALFLFVRDWEVTERNLVDGWG